MFTEFYHLMRVLNFLLLLSNNKYICTVSKVWTYTPA